MSNEQLFNELKNYIDIDEGFGTCFYNGCDIEFEQLEDYDRIRIYSKFGIYELWEEPAEVYNNETCEFEYDGINYKLFNSEDLTEELFDNRVLTNILGV